MRWRRSSVVVGALLLNACDYNDIKDENERLHAELASLRKANSELQNTNAELSADISSVRAERDSIVIPVAYLKVRVAFGVVRIGDNPRTTLPRLSPVGELTGDALTVPMVDPGTTAPDLADSGSSSVLTLTFVPKDPAALERIDFRKLEQLSAFRFRIRPFLDRIDMRIDPNVDVRLTIIVNGVEFASTTSISNSPEGSDRWDTIEIGDQTRGLRERYVAYLQRSASQ